MTDPDAPVLSELVKMEGLLNSDAPDPAVGISTTETPGSILDRLNARIAAAPALTDIDGLFVDLRDARDEIVRIQGALDLMMAAEQLRPAGQIPPMPGTVVQHVQTDPEVLELLREARERLSVNALSTVSDRIERSIHLLGD